MNPIDEEQARDTYLLIVQWLYDQNVRGEIYVHPCGKPGYYDMGSSSREWSSDILVRLGILKYYPDGARHSNAYFVLCSTWDVKEFAAKAIADVPTFDEILIAALHIFSDRFQDVRDADDEFIGIQFDEHPQKCVHRPILERLAARGYCRKSETDYLWTERMSPLVWRMWGPQLPPNSFARH